LHDLKRSHYNRVWNLASEIATHLSGARNDRVECHSEPFAPCHSERSEESNSAQGKLREESFAQLRTVSGDSSPSVFIWPPQHDLTARSHLAFVI